MKALLNARSLFAARALPLPVRFDALSFGLAGILAMLAGLAWYGAQAGLQRLPQLPGLIVTP
jgi:hypothetical protein